MIFYYSATGNTRFAANYLADKLNTKAIDILGPDLDMEKVRNAGVVGLMFPIYCWGIPPVMSDFIEKLLSYAEAETYLWALCTCGDEAGTAMRRLDSKIRSRRGKGVQAIFSLIMPNTYVLLPGFDVDAPEVEKRKLQEAPRRLDKIAEAVGLRKTGVYDVSQGSLPALRSMLFPLFVKFGIFPSKWHSSPQCIGCGKCASVCPSGNIKMADGRPLWGKRCFSCCACFHICPVHAVAYGRITRGKSQYFCPL